MIFQKYSLEHSPKKSILLMCLLVHQKTSVLEAVFLGGDGWWALHLYELLKDVIDKLDLTAFLFGDDDSLAEIFDNTLVLFSDWSILFFLVF